MSAGQTNLKVGDKVVIMGITGDDSDLNGLTGEVTHPFAFGATGKGWIGVYLDQENIRRGEKVNVKATEVALIEESVFEVGQMTNLGRIDDKTNTQVFINNSWYANSLVKLQDENTSLSEVCIEPDMDFIEGEILKNYLPEGSFAVLVHPDSFDENIFETYLEYEGLDLDEADKKEWLEVLLVDNSPAGAYVIQGQVLFANKVTEQVILTNDTAVKQSEDVSLIGEGKSAIDYSQKVAALCAPAFVDKKDLNNG